MVLWENERSGRPIGSLREKHIKERMCMEVCTKPSAKAAGRSKEKRTVQTS